ncbi:MAG: peptide chain release factor N(5)-glutamine methyltransferase [Proteobacteria bacterium]|nr:peptide chain release factor N(5)-glutamine methyltransferase [Pseudomonadota bacterium]
MPGRPLAAPQQGQGDGGADRAAAREGTQRARREGSGDAPRPDRQRRPQRPHPHLQLPAGAADRPPHQPDALQAAADPRWRPRRSDRGAAGGAGGRATRRARKRRRSLNRGLTVAEALGNARRVGVDRLDAQLLLARVLAQPRSWLIAHDDAIVDGAQLARWRAWLTRRAAGEPLAYLLGEKEFHGLTLEVGPAVLVPRPDTEVLVEWALELLAGPLPAAVPDVVDLGTGSGAIALAVKHGHAAARLTATDASAAALEIARRNGARLGLAVEWQHGSWWEPLAGRRFDLALSNPPYIAGADPHLAALRHEPTLALTPGGNGLAALAAIIAGAPAHLAPGGWLLVEHGYDQAAAVRGLYADAGFVDVTTRHDLGGQPRCTGGRGVL